ncbi:MAG: response regulator [Candidatus Eisenbacteria bacterium]|nr:response regulator [Candidatus Eisenbacteria bacterium]
MKVLTVDDSKTSRAVVAHTLAQLGLTVIQASDGAEGLEFMRASKPDLVIADVQMPTMDGMAMLTAKARDPIIAGIPVIMLTALADQEFVLQCLKKGAKGYIVKPFEKKTLVQKVCKLLHIEPPSAGGAQARPRGPLVLAVDRDEKVLSALMEIMLDGCELVTALDVRIAMRLAKERHPESLWVDAGQSPELVKMLVDQLREDGTRKFVAMVPRGAAMPPGLASLGIQSALPKPLIRLEVREFAASHLGIFQRFLERVEGGVVMKIPGDAQARRREWQPALDTEVRAGLERAAAERAPRLAVDLGAVTAGNDLHLVAGLADVVTMCRDLGLDLVLVIQDSEVLQAFGAYQELKGIRCFGSLKEAMTAGPAAARAAA